MAFARNYTQRELDYIRDNYASKTCAEMASHLGRSKSGVYKKMRDMRLVGKDARKAPRPMESPDGIRPSMDRTTANSTTDSIGRPMSDRQRLVALRDLLWQRLQEADPSEAARLAPEYRKTIERIEAADAGTGGSAEPDDGLADVIALVQ